MEKDLSDRLDLIESKLDSISKSLNDLHIKADRADVGMRSALKKLGE